MNDLELSYRSITNRYDIERRKAEQDYEYQKNRYLSSNQYIFNPNYSIYPPEGILNCIDSKPIINKKLLLL